MPANRIGEILLHSGRITKDQLDTCLKEQSGTKELVGDIIRKNGFASGKDVALALSQQLNIPYIELDEDFKLSADDVRLVPEPVARKFCILPYKKTENILTILMKDPLDIEAVDTIRTLTSLNIQRAVNTEENILAIINKYYKVEAHIESDLQDILELESGKNGEAITDERVDSDQLRVIANDAPVVKFVNLLLLQAVRDRASDIHFEPGERNVNVRLRIDGVLRLVTPPPKHLYQAVVTRIKILSNMNIAERRLPQDGRFKFRVGGHIIDIRASSLPEAHGEKLVLRILDKSALIVDMKDIGFEQQMLEDFQRILKEPHGIILLTGPTGSGKTTTLYGALSFLKSPDVNIQTVEDPIEYLIEGVNQMQVKPQIGLSFANALRSILRQDPNIIMIGEIRDADTASIAIRASLTGHLVLSTLHTNDATSAVHRLKDIGIEPYLIAATLNLAISQRLVRVICPKCKHEARPPEATLNKLISVNPDVPKWKFFEGKGCRACYNTGYKGRIGIFEFLEITNQLRDTMLGTGNQNIFRKKAIEMGMTSLIADGLNKVKYGITTIQEVLSVCPPIEAP